MATGALDANGIWIYGEDDTEATHSDLLNLGQDATSDAVGDLKTRVTALEAVGPSGLLGYSTNSAYNNTALTTICTVTVSVTSGRRYEVCAAVSATMAAAGTPRIRLGGTSGVPTDYLIWRAASGTLDGIAGSYLYVATSTASITFQLNADSTGANLVIPAGSARLWVKDITQVT